MATKDIFDQWLRASGRADPSAWTATLDLYDSFRAYCVERGDVVEGGLQEFCARLRRTMIPKRRKHSRGFKGYRLRQDGKRISAWREQRLAAHRANLNMEAGAG